MNNTQLENCLDWNSVIRGDGRDKSRLSSIKCDAVNVSGHMTAAVNNENDGLPLVISLDNYKDHVPKLSDELIQGVLRGGAQNVDIRTFKSRKKFLVDGVMHCHCHRW